jgi:hypothetical protein
MAYRVSQGYALKVGGEKGLVYFIIYLKGLGVCNSRKDMAVTTNSI